MSRKTFAELIDPEYTLEDALALCLDEARAYRADARMCRRDGHDLFSSVYYNFARFKLTQAKEIKRRLTKV